MRLSLFIAALAVTTPAWAEQTVPVVHVDNEVGTKVVVERLDDHGHAVAVCRAPCNQPLDPSHAYRLTSDAFRPTNHFRLPPSQAVDVRIEPRTNRGLVTSIVLMSVSGAFATGAGAAIAWAILDTHVNNVGVATAIAVPMIAASLATGIPGAVLLGKSIESRATTIESDRAVASVRVPIPRATGFTFPLLTQTF